MHHTVWLVVVGAVACACAQENHRDAPKYQFRKFVSKVRTSGVRPPTTPTPEATSTPPPTLATEEIPTKPEAGKEQSVEVRQSRQSDVNATSTEDVHVSPSEASTPDVNATSSAAEKPKAEKLFGLPDLRTHLLAQQQRQQQLAFEALRAAAQTPSFGANRPFQQPSVSDLQQLLQLMQHAQQGNQFSFYAQPQQQQQGFGSPGGFFAPQGAYQPTPAFFAPNPTQFGAPAPPQHQGLNFGGVGQQGTFEGAITLPYNPPPTPNYVFHNGAYHVQGSSALPPVPSGPQLEGPPPTRYTVATPVPSGPPLSPAVQEPAQEAPRPPLGTFVSRPSALPPPPPPQFANTVFQRPVGGNPFGQQQGFRPQQQQESFLPPPAFGQRPSQQQGSLQQPSLPPFQQQFPQGPLQPPFQQQGPLQPPFQQQGPQQPPFQQQSSQGPPQPPFQQQGPQQPPFQQQQFFGQQQQGFGGAGAPFNSRAPVFFPPAPAQAFTTSSDAQKDQEEPQLPDDNEVKEVKEPSRPVPSFSFAKGNQGAQQPGSFILVSQVRGSHQQVNHQQGKP